MTKRSGLVRHLGERRLIQWFQELITPYEKALLSGIEDAVAVSFNDDAIVVNSDMLVSSTDVLPGMTAREIAWKAGVMGLSDLAAKGALPWGILVSLGLPPDTDANFAAALVSGLNSVCREHDTYYLGGDTNQCLELVIDCTAFGSVPKKYLIRRSGARAGDIVAVTGEFGYTAALFKAVLNEQQKTIKLPTKIREKALHPTARIREGHALAIANLVSAAIDSSDGLAWSLHELANASRVGFQINSLPIPSLCLKFAAQNKLDAIDLALYGGEEFELVLTIPVEKWPEAQATIHNMNGQLFPIGKVVDDPEQMLIMNAEERVIEPKGYEHFSE